MSAQREPDFTIVHFPEERAFTTKSSLSIILLRAFKAVVPSFSIPKVIPSAK